MSLTSMFDPSQDLESRLEEAAALLKQAADEEGVDLDQLDPSEVNDMVSSIAEAGEDGDDEEEGDEEEEEDDEEEEGKTAGVVTYADVAYELAKQASAEGIDLGSVDPETYDEMFNKTAAYMTDPSAQEEAAKFASQAEQMDTLGRIAARGFVDELDKLAADEDDDEDEDDKVQKKQAAARRVAKAVRKAVKKKGFGAKTLAAVKRTGRAVGRKIDSGVMAVGRGTMKGTRYATKKTQKGLSKVEKGLNRGIRSEKIQRRVGAGVLAGGAAGAGGAAYAHNKKAFDEAVQEAAYEMLAEAGYDV